MTYPIHIAFCVDLHYLNYVRVTVRSIIDTHEETDVYVHILSDNIPQERQLEFINEFSWASFMHIEFHQVDDTPLQGLQAWSKYTWYRLLLPTVLPADVHRVLYLDADTLVTDNLTDLFATDLTDLALAGVIDPMDFDDEAYRRCGYERHKYYICAGVLLINLDYWREHDMQRQLVEWSQAHPDIKFHDQDCINYVCRDCRTLLPVRYGLIDELFKFDLLYQPGHLDEIMEGLENPAIIHYAGKAPWLIDVNEHVFSDRWHEVNRKLRPPVKRSYKSSGLLRLKIIVYRLLHPKMSRRAFSVKAVKSRIIRAKLEQNG